MGMFSKAKYEELKRPFILDTYTMPQEEREMGIISIEVQLNVLGEVKYGYVSFVLTNKTLYEDGGYEEMLKSLESCEEQYVRVRLKYKKDKLKDIEILLDSLAELYNDARFLKMERIGAGINEKSCREGRSY